MTDTVELINQFVKDPWSLKSALILFLAVALIVSILCIISGLKVRRESRWVGWLSIILGSIVAIASVALIIFVVFFGFNSP